MLFKTWLSSISRIIFGLSIYNISALKVGETALNFSILIKVNFASEASLAWKIVFRSQKLPEMNEKEPKLA